MARFPAYSHHHLHMQQYNTRELILYRDSPMSALNNLKGRGGEGALSTTQKRPMCSCIIIIIVIVRVGSIYGYTISTKL